LFALFGLIALLAPQPVAASCAAGSAPAYTDIRYISVRQFSWVGNVRPGFEVEGVDLPWRSNITLKGFRSVPLIGTYVAADPRGLFQALTAVLERNRFLDMQLTVLEKCCTLDGPEDSVSVARCGVGTTVGTLPPENGIFDENSQTTAFKALEEQLRQVIFSAKWNPADVKRK
jgi:hypothetical protein